MEQNKQHQSVNHTSGTSVPNATARVDQEPMGLASLSQVETIFYPDTLDSASSRAGPMQQQQYADDVSSRISVATISTSASSAYRRQEAGRSFNVLNDAYFLPSDDDEFARLNKQHTAVVLGLSGLYPAHEVVETILAPRDGVHQSIMDVGCGTGAWAVAMAKDFEHCQVVGIDLAPVPLDPDSVPPNCRFEIDDVNNGMQHYYGQFDVIHARFLAAGLKDWKKCQAEIERCLKPGGIMLWIDVDYDLLTQDKNVYLAPASDAHPDGSWVARVFYEVRRVAVVVGGSSLFATPDTLSWGLWDDELLDPDTCQRADMFVPVGPWQTDSDQFQNQRLSHMGSLIRQDFAIGMRAFHPTLQKVGISPQTCNEWSDRAEEEMNTMIQPIYVRVPCAWGRRRAGPNLPAPPLPERRVKDETGSARMPPYPHIHIHTTKEEAARAYELRNKSKTFTPPPNPPALQGTGGS